MNINTLKKERNYGIDLLRIVCMMMIPIIHIITHGGILDNCVKLSLNYEITSLLLTTVIFAVNCFALITGYVYFGKETKYYRLSNIWCSVFFYSILILITFFIVTPDKITTTQILKSILPTLFNNYWYFTAYFGMFILSPFINLGLKYFNKKQDLIVSISIIIIFSILPTFLNRGNIFQLNYGYSVLWLLILYYFGGLSNKYNIPNLLKEEKWIIIWIITIILAWGCKSLTEYIFILKSINSTYFKTFTNYISPFILIGSYALFCFFINFKIKGSISKTLIKFFTPVSFGVYLIHDNPLTREFLIKNKFAFIGHLNPIKMILIILLIGLIIFIICSLIDWVRELLFRKLKIKQILINTENKINYKIKAKLDNN